MKRRTGIHVTSGTASALYLFSTLLTGWPAIANVPLPTGAQFHQSLQMKDMHWMSVLSADQVKDVRSALSSNYDPLVESAIASVVLHGLDELWPLFEDGVGHPKSAARLLGETYARIRRAGGEPYAELREVLTGELPGDEFIPNCDKMDYCRPVRHMITSVIVIHEVRAVRAGKKKAPDWNGLVLSEFQKALIESSRLGAGAAITQIVDELAAAGVVSTRETVLLQVLRTYPLEQYAPLVLSKLEGDAQGGRYGNDLLVQSLRWRGTKLTKQEVVRLRSVFETIRKADLRPATESLLIAIESELE